MAHELAEGQGFQVMRCAHGDQSYGLEMRRVRSILRRDLLEDPLDYAEADGAAGWLPARYGGVPVWNLGSLLGDPAPRRRDDSQRVVVVGSDTLQDDPSGRWGLLVDGISRAIWVPNAALHQLPSTLLGRALSPYLGVVRSDDEHFLLLCPDRLRPGVAGEALANGGPIPRSSGSAAILPPPRGLAATGRRRPPSPGRIVVFPLSSPAGPPVSCALSVTEVAEILYLPPTLPVPRAPDFVLGLAAWRGGVIPVIDLAARLGLPERPHPGDARLLVARCREPGDAAKSYAHVGFQVPPAIKVVPLQGAAPASEHSFSFDPRFARGTFVFEHEPIVVLDPAELLLSA